MESTKISVPNFFYDLLVFVSPTILLVIGFSIGFQCFSSSFIETYVTNFKASYIIFVMFAVLFMSYEYGRIAEALSSFYVAAIIQFLKKKNILKNSDFNMNLQEQIGELNLAFEVPEEKKGSKWQIYFAAALYAPHIGADLLKRYAWEKLSRNSAFTFLLLNIFNLIIIIINLFGVQIKSTGDYGFGSIIFTITIICLLIATYYEYYKRNCWNNDLLIKISPIIKEAKDKSTTGINTN